MTGPVNGAELLASIQPVLRTIRVQVCLRPDLLEQWEKLSVELAEAQAATATGARLAANKGATSKAKAAAKKLQALETEIDEKSPWFEFRALPNPDYQALCDRHPPRKDNQLDFFKGYNVEAVQNALVRECLIDPEFKSDDDWKMLEQVCAPSQWAALRDAAVEANGGEVAVPKSVLASEVLARRGSDSE